MSLFDEECPHCDDAPPPLQLDTHVARAHADLPPCTARIETERGGLYTCAFRAGHEKGQYGRWHASVHGEVTGRYVWNDSAQGATPHRAPEPSYSLDKLKAMGVLSHTIVAASEHVAEQPTTADTGRRCPRCDCPDGHIQCEHCKVCPHARETGTTVANSAQTREQTPDEQFRTLFSRTAKLNDAVSALLNPQWGAKAGILPEGHPLHPGVRQSEEQAAPVDWQAIAKRRERELKKVGEARHRAEQVIARVRAVIAERRTEVAERETDGILPFGTPGASWCDAVTVTCDRIDDALRPETASVGVPAEPEQGEAP